VSRILAIDTTSEFGSLALAEDGVVFEELPVHSPGGFSQSLYVHIEELLARHGWRIDEMGCFAAAAGPGSFTGVRIGLTAAKGLAEATGVKAAGISNLKALADYATGTRRAAVIDARRGEIYGAVYDAELNPVTPEIVAPFREWWESLPSPLSSFISPDTGPFRSTLPTGVMVLEQRSIAAGVARIAAARMQSGEAMDPAALDANYIRHSDAELLWRDR
jgi:tRNA threonylcarbamoyladenosine biosynthesis protein TsaB